MTTHRSQLPKVILGSLLLIVTVLSLGAALAWHKYQSIQAASQQGEPAEQPEMVSLARSLATGFRGSVTAIGTVRAPRSITLRNEIAGQVVSVPLQAGQIVEQGQVLVVLDASVEQASLLSAQARQRMAQSMLERTQRIARANASSGNEIDQSEAEMAQADAEVARLQAVIDKKTLRAPFRAKAGLIDTHPGQFLSEGTEITTLQGIDDYILVDFMMPQAVADSVEIGQEVRLLVQPAPVAAQIIALDSLADRASRNLMGRARLEQPPSFLQPNDSVKVEITFGPERSGVVVPAGALRRAPTGAFVYVAQPDQTGGLRAVAKAVTPGQSIGTSVMILGGLDADESVIVDGSFKLREGSLVMAVATPQTESTATATGIASQR